jgi:hypothetical protein
MTRTEFGYWLRGIFDQYSVAAVTPMVLAKAREVLELTPAKAEPVALHKIHLSTGFCIHNINIRESCAACGSVGRIFAVRLPGYAREVYIPNYDRPTRNEDDEAGAEAAEPARSERGEAGSGVQGIG